MGLVSRGPDSVRVTRQEGIVLGMLVRNQGRYLNSARIEVTLDPSGRTSGPDNLVRQVIGNLRRKTSRLGVLIDIRKTYGWMLAVPVTLVGDTAPAPAAKPKRDDLAERVERLERVVFG